MTKNDSWYLSTAISIPPDQQHFHLGHTRGELAPKGRYWIQSLCLRGRHHEKQNQPKVANPQLQPPSSPNHCYFTQYQHERCSFHIIPIDPTCWFGRCIRFCPSRTTEQKKVQSDVDTGHSTLGIVYSMHYEETRPTPHSNTPVINTWAQLRRIGSTVETHGPWNSIRTNFRWVVRWGCRWCWATFRGAGTHWRPAIAQRSLPVISREAHRWSEYVQWPGLCWTLGKHGRGGTSESVEKFGSGANNFSVPQKGNRKSPTVSQCYDRLLQGCGAPQSRLLSVGGTSATHLVAPFVGPNGFRFYDEDWCKIFFCSSSTTIFTHKN